MVATVHYEKDYDNAFWDGTQLVFGDGDGTVFGRFTKPIDVLGHELSHAVTEFTANLTYQGQSGALNESVSDVFGACVKQRHLGPGRRLRRLVGRRGHLRRGRQRQGVAVDGVTRARRTTTRSWARTPRSARCRTTSQTTEDNGGVHINSGIPNRAFVLAAKAIGGDSWSGAGRIWYAALTSGLAAGSDFATFAAATVAAAGEHADAVRQAWTTVGVTPGLGVDRIARPAGAVLGGRGGPLGRLRRDPQAGLGRPRLRRPARPEGPRARRPHRLRRRTDRRSPRPDRFTYQFRHRDAECTVPEPALTPDLRDLADLVLGD